MQPQTVDSLKAAGHYFEAGALAHAMRRDDNYGCHFGMQSSRALAIHQFKQGWKAAEAAAAHKAACDRNPFSRGAVRTSNGYVPADR